MEAVVKQIGKSYWEGLYEEMVQQLEVLLKVPEHTIIHKAQSALLVTKQIVQQLEAHIVQYDFKDQQEEIFFFKKVKPNFYCKLLYYHKLFNMEIARPIGNPSEQQRYLERELERIKEFFDDNKFFYQYFRSGEQYLDDKLFLRRSEEVSLALHLHDIHSNPGFTTHYDYILSRIQANELLMDYLNNALAKLNGQPTSDKKQVVIPTKTLDWTDAKSALIELIYAFKAKGSFNQGKATLKEITDYIQLVFNVELSNPSRDFQEILRRKTGYTLYMDSLRDSYLKYIDNIENKQHR